MTSYWNKLTNCMSEQLKVKAGDMAINRGQEYREKLEDCDFLDRI